MHKELRQLSITQLKRIVDYKYDMLLDGRQYSSLVFSPLCIGLGLDEYIEKPTNEKIEIFLKENEYDFGTVYNSNEEVVSIANKVIKNQEKISFLFLIIQQIENSFKENIYLTGDAASFYKNYLSSLGEEDEATFSTIHIFAEDYVPFVISDNPLSVMLRTEKDKLCKYTSERQWKIIYNIIGGFFIERSGF